MSDIRKRAADAVRKTAVGQFAFQDVADAALLAALDPEDEALVQHVARAIFDAWEARQDREASMAWREAQELAGAAIASLKARTQGERST